MIKTASTLFLYLLWGLATLILSQCTDSSPPKVDAPDRSVETWLCAGQSNIKFSVERAKHARAFPPNLGRRIERQEIFYASVDEEPLESLDQLQWYQMTAPGLESQSAFCLLFALERAERTNAPIAVISSAVGGTLLETWIPRDQLVDTETFVPMHPTVSPGASYDAKIAGLEGQTLTGVIWYQGEANAGEWPRYGRPYAELLPVLVSTWRDLFDNETLPFLFVQLPEYEEDGFDTEPGFGHIRAAQKSAADALSDVAVVSALGTGDPQDLHPPDKRVLARRVAVEAGRVLAQRPTELTLQVRRQDRTITIQAPSDCLQSLILEPGIGADPAFQVCSAMEGSCVTPALVTAADEIVLSVTDTAFEVVEPLRLRYGLTHSPEHYLSCGGDYVYPAQVVEIPAQF